MHGFYEHLLHFRKLNVFLVASLAFHLGRDAADDDDGVSSPYLVGETREIYQITFADITA